MPELPEVEALKRGLEQKIIGSIIKNIEILNGKIVSGSGTRRVINNDKILEFTGKLRDKKIMAIDRLAKNLIFTMSDKSIILVHLKMTGQLVFKSHNFDSYLQGGHPIEESENTLPHKHTYIIFTLSNGTLYYNDVRQFGYVLYFKDYQELENLNHFKNTSVEPFSPNFSYKYFKDKLLQNKSPIKKVFLDQKIVNGLGNIYADEVCFASSVLPMRRCNTLNETEIKSLYKNIRLILDKAINSGGSSVANYLLADGKRGNYAHFHKAYKQENKPCKFKVGNKKCTGMVQKTVFLGRGTHFCPVHQK